MAPGSRSHIRVSLSCGFYLGSKIDTDTVGTLCGSEFDLRTQKTFTASWHFL